MESKEIEFLRGLRKKVLFGAAESSKEESIDCLSLYTLTKFLSGAGGKIVLNLSPSTVMFETEEDALSYRENNTHLAGTHVVKVYIKEHYFRGGSITSVMAKINKDGRSVIAYVPRMPNVEVLGLSHG